MEENPEDAVVPFMVLPIAPYELLYLGDALTEFN